MTERPALVCRAVTPEGDLGCGRTPDQLIEYVHAAAEFGLTPEEYVRQEEGTLNRFNGHFLCTDCYLAAGSPRSRTGWVAP